VDECHRLLRDLLEENAALRASGETAGQYAERLNAELHDERRRSATALAAETERRNQAN
jgi:hypothetical protein